MNRPYAVAAGFSGSLAQRDGFSAMYCRMWFSSASSRMMRS